MSRAGEQGEPYTSFLCLSLANLAAMRQAKAQARKLTAQASVQATKINQRRKPECKQLQQNN
jgi:hypothetical protein